MDSVASYGWKVANDEIENGVEEIACSTDGREETLIQMFSR
jgi:hypothetical protein